MESVVSTEHRRWVDETQQYVMAALSGDGSGHDWWHVERVWRSARHIAQYESVDLVIVELAALLHDIADHKFHDGDETAGPRVARAHLERIGVSEAVIAHVCEIIRDLSFKGAGTTSPMRTREGMVVQDADRIDAIGAIGIARAFAYGGYAGREIHNPDIPLVHHDSFEAYKNNTAPTINHFYEKLLLLRDRVNTPTAKRIAEGRHRYMEEFLKRFYREWNGDV